MKKRKLKGLGLFALLTLAFNPIITNAATLETACNVSVSGNDITLGGHPTTSLNFAVDGTGFPGTGGANAQVRLCFYSTLPTLADTTSCDVAVTEQTGINYVSLYGVASDTSCIWSYVVDGNNGNSRANAVVGAQPPLTQSVPIFSPLGFLVLLSGLVWFGNRKKVKI